MMQHFLHAFWPSSVLTALQMTVNPCWLSFQLCSCFSRIHFPYTCHALCVTLLLLITKDWRGLIGVAWSVFCGLCASWCVRDLTLSCNFPKIPLWWFSHFGLPFPFLFIPTNLPRLMKPSPTILVRLWWRTYQLLHADYVVCMAPSQHTKLYRFVMCNVLGCCYYYYFKMNTTLTRL